MQGAGAAACETLNGWPATVAVPVRALVAVLAVTAKVTEPEPVRPAPLEKLRKLVEVAVLHAHPGCVVTVIVPVDAVSATLTLDGLIE